VLRCRRSGGDAHAGGALDPGRVDLVGILDQVGVRAVPGRHLHQPVAVGGLRRADHDHHVGARGELLHRVLAVLRRVADVVLARELDPGEAALDRLEDLAGVVHGEGRLGHASDPGGICQLQRLDVVHPLDEVGALRRLAQRPLHLHVPGVAHHQHLTALLGHAPRLHVHLGDQRTGGVDHAQLARIGVRAHGGRDTVGAEDEQGAGRDLGRIVDEDGAALAQRLHHVAVVHDLVAHVDGRAEAVEGPLHDLDGTVDAGAEAAGAGEEDVHGGQPSAAELPPLRGPPGPR
jgi:hypothetical protein